MKNIETTKYLNKQNNANNIFLNTRFPIEQMITKSKEMFS